MIGGNPLLPSFPQIRAAALKAVQAYNGKLPPPVDVSGKPIPDPVPVHSEGRGAYLPYRGVENHGVPSQRAFEEAPEGYTDGTIPVWDQEEEHPNAINVRVIRDDAEQINDWRVFNTVAPASTSQAPAQLTGRNRTRTKLTIENLSTTDSIWIGPNQQVTVINGYQLMAGQSKDINTTEECYAISNTVNAVQVAVVQEFAKEA